VFLDLKGPHDLHYLKCGPDECIPLRFKESKKDLLVLRHCIIFRCALDSNVYLLMIYYIDTFV